MKHFGKNLLIAAIVIIAAQAKFMRCKFGMASSFLQGFSQGFTANHYLQTSDCYKQAYRLEFAGLELTRSFYPSHFTAVEWMTPITRGSEFLTQLTNEFTSCYTTNFAKQMATRLSTFPGIIDLVTTIAIAILKNALQPGKSDLYNAWRNYRKA